MVVDHFRKQWEYQPAIQYQPWPVPILPAPTISPEDIKEFQDLLDKARVIDKALGQPDCGLEEKRAAIKKIADQLGVNIDFV